MLLKQGTFFGIIFCQKGGPALAGRFLVTICQKEGPIEDGRIPCGLPCYLLSEGICQKLLKYN